MWKAYSSEYGTLKDEASLADRKSNFANTLDEIIEHNRNPKRSFTKGLNQFSDMSHEEFMSYFHMSETPNEEQNCSATHERQEVDKKVKFEDIPEHWDWREHGGVSPVKNQGKCGSCWTFSTVGALEAHELLKYGEFTPLAEQQLVDCAQAFDNHGCEGGLPSHAFEYILYAGGISTETAYPYHAVDEACTVESSTFALQVSGGSVNVTEGDEVELKHAVFEHGPVSIAFQVVAGFKDYSSGVYTSDVCKNGSSDVNHAVLAVGFGHEDGKDYWLVKNSWGTAWGDQGYFKIERGTNMCGVAQCNSFPQDVVRVGGKPQIEEKFIQ
jgi:cathepsin H